MKNDIISDLDIKESEVENYTCIMKNDVKHIYITLKSRGIFCPRCGAYTKRVKEYKNKVINHSIYINQKCVINYHARRYICPYCDKTTFESNPFCEDNILTSQKTIENVLKLLKEYNQTFSSVARITHMSTMQVMRIFDDHVQIKRKKLSSSICIDEFYFSRTARNKYALMIIDFTKGNIIDLLESRHKHNLYNYFRNIPYEERKFVKYISIDMNEIYRDVLNLYFKHAILCVDSFHVVKLITTALDNVRLRILRRYSDNKKSDEYYLLKYQKHLLNIEVKFDTYSETKTNHHFKYKVSSRRKFEMLLAIDDELKLAYQLKEDYLEFNSLKNNREELEVALDSILDEFISSNIQEFVHVAYTLKNWRDEILNSFYTDFRIKRNKDGSIKKEAYRISNGPIEGRNKYVKIILHLANGYSNFNRFRNRVMYVLNKKEQPYKHKIK